MPNYNSPVNKGMTTHQNNIDNAISIMYSVTLKQKERTELTRKTIFAVLMMQEQLIG